MYFVWPLPTGALFEVKDGKVRFHWKDYRTGLSREMKLDTDEFIRRYLGMGKAGLRVEGDTWKNQVLQNAKLSSLCFQA